MIIYSNLVTSNQFFSPKDLLIAVRSWMWDSRNLYDRWGCSTGKITSILFPSRIRGEI